jgi:hypothetical protein
MLRGVFVGCLVAVPAWADTVFLYNGTTIDGVIKTRHETSIELQIGDIGRIFVNLEAIESIEKNDRDGSEQSSRLSLERRREDVASVESSAKESDAGAEDTEEDLTADPFKQYTKKEDVEPELRKRIERYIHDLTRQKRRYRVQAERRLTSVGEPTVPFLRDVIGHNNHLVRLAVLRILEKVGNDAALAPTMDRLEDENTFVREQAAKTLHALTGEKFGFRANSGPKARDKAVAAWRAWYEKEMAELDEELDAAEAPDDAASEGAPESGSSPSSKPRRKPVRPTSTVKPPPEAKKEARS